MEDQVIANRLGPTNSAPVIGNGETAPGVTMTLGEPTVFPPSPLTLIGPELALAGTMAVNCVREFMLNDARVPLNVMLVMESRFAPVMVTLALTGPLCGEKLIAPGAAGDCPSTLLRSNQARLFGKALKKL